MWFRPKVPFCSKFIPRSIGFGGGGTLVHSISNAFLKFLRMEDMENNVKHKVIVLCKFNIAIWEWGKKLGKVWGDLIIWTLAS